MKHSDTVSGLFWLFLGITLFVWAAKYPIGSITKPGPGFYPLLLGSLLILLSSALLVKPRTLDAGETIEPPKSLKSRFGRVPYSIGVFLFGTFIFERVGYLITTFIIIVLLRLGTGRRHWKQALVMGVLVAVGVYLVFVLLLEQPLPAGILGV